MDSESTGRTWGAWRITAVYLFVGTFWIFLSDLIVTRSNWGTELILTAEVVKGSLFVAGSTVLLFVLVTREQRALEATNDELERSLRHVSVLHRVLRHNLRNSCDVIQNNVALLETDRVDAAPCRDRIARQATQLMAIAEKSRHLRDIALDDVDPIQTSVAAVVDEAIAAVREEAPAATFERSLEPDLQVYAHPRLAVAIEELLRSAVTHHDDDSPTVTVSSFQDDGWTTIEIADDGPGLPAPERNALAGDHEGPLNHSRGIGLWLVRFLVEDAGGELTATSGSDGTVVQVRLPASAAAERSKWHGGGNPLALS